MIATGALLASGGPALGRAAPALSPALISASTLCGGDTARAVTYGRVDGLVVAELDDTATIASWQEERAAPVLSIQSPLRSGPSAVWAVCIFRGAFSFPAAPSPAGSPAPSYDLLTLLHSPSGTVLLDSASRASSPNARTPQEALGLTPRLALDSVDPLASFHDYSHAWESSSTYQGMDNNRVDQAVAGLPNANCSSPYGATVVYETMWYQTSPGNNFELGTGHQCQDQYRYWYWGFSVNGTWSSLGYQTGISNGVSHAFHVRKVNSGFNGWQVYYEIDGVVKKTYATNSTLSNDLDVGLESYCSNCTVTEYLNQQLQYQQSGTWYYWSGEDGHQVNYPPMCGYWQSQSIWVSGQGTPC